MLYSSWWTWWRWTWKLNEENDDDAGDADGVAPAWGHLDEKALVHRLCYLCRCWWHLHSWCASDFSTTTSKEILELSLKPCWDACVVVDTKPQAWANIWRQHQNGLKNVNCVLYQTCGCCHNKMQLVSGLKMGVGRCWSNIAFTMNWLRNSITFWNTVIRQRPEILIAGRKDSEKSGHGNSPQ